MVPRETSGTDDRKLAILVISTDPSREDNSLKGRFPHRKGSKKHQSSKKIKGNRLSTCLTNFQRPA